MKEEISQSELDKANINIIINNSDDNNNEIKNNQNDNNSLSKSSPNLSIGNLKTILDNNSSLGPINHNSSVGFFSNSSNSMINSLINHNSATSESGESANPINFNLNQEGIDNNDNNDNNINNVIFSNNLKENIPSLNIKKSKYI